MCKAVQGRLLLTPRHKQATVSVGPQNRQTGMGREQGPCPIPNVYHTTISDDIIFRLFLCEFQLKSFMGPQPVNAAVEVISF
jgi:hypothetical protein